MADTVTKTPFEIDSTDGITVVRGYTWAPADADEPRAIVQLVHGMAEYIDRYDDFARFLAAEGYLVVGHDHLGHGETQPDAFLRGHIPYDGKETLIEDAQAVQEMVSDEYPQTPVFLLGHSMGSFVARAMLRHHGADLAGVILIGTGYVPPSTSKAGHMLAHLICLSRGEDCHSELLHSLADGAYAKAIEDAQTSCDWLNTDPAAVAAYIEDPICGFMFTAGGYATLTDLTAEVCDPATVRFIPLHVPQLYLSGSEDPVGDRGDGVRKAAQLALDAGAKDVQIKLYGGMRHEILNEPEHAQVYDDVLQWINRICR